jgi:hypothetical protein
LAVRTWLDRVDRACARLVARGDDPGADVPTRSWAADRAELIRPAALGAVALLAIGVAATHRDALFRGRRLLDWPLHLPLVSRPGDVRRWVCLIAFFGGIALLCWAWVRIARVARRGGVAPALLIAIFGVWCLPLLAAPPLLGRDAYYYIAAGELSVRGLDANRVSPAALGERDSYYAVHPAWRHTHSPYGPVAARVDAAAVTVARHRMNPSVIALRGAAIAGLLLMAVALPTLARRAGHDPGHALALALLNPLVVLNVVGGAHNDGVMLGLLVAGLAVGWTGGRERGRTGARVAGIVLCALATGVKLPAAGGVFLLGWEWAGRDVPVRRRLLPVAGAAVIAAATLAVAAWRIPEGWGWVGALGVPWRAQGFMAPVNAFGYVVGSFTGVDTDTTIAIARVLGLLVALAVVAAVLWRTSVLGGVRALGIALGLFALLGSTLFPWYLTWSVVLLAAAGPRVLRGPLLGVSIALCFLVTPVGGVVLDSFAGVAKVGMALVALALDALLAWAIVRAWSGDQPRPGAVAPRRETVGSTLSTT